MLTDAEHAAVIKRVLNNDDYVHLDDERAALKRAIVVLAPTHPCWCEACGSEHEPPS